MLKAGNTDNIAYVQVFENLPEPFGGIDQRLIAVVIAPIDIVKRLTTMTASQQPARVSAEDDASEQDASINALDFADI